MASSALTCTPDTTTAPLPRRISNRDVRVVFFQSRMCVIDEYRERLKYTTLDFVEFLEMLGRLADVMSIPTDADFESVGVTNIVDYEIKLNQASSPRQRSATWTRRRPSAGVLTASSRPLAEKLGKFLALLMARLAVDVMKVDEVAAPGSSELILRSFVPRFLSRGQLEALSVYNHRL